MVHRAFVSDLLRTQGVEPPARSVPRPAAGLVARGGEAAWRLLPLRGRPPLTKALVGVIGEEVTVRDDKARRELGYAARVSRADGLAAMREDQRAAAGPLPGGS